MAESAYRKEWKKKNPDKVRKYWKQDKERHPERFKETTKRYRMKHLETLLPKEAQQARERRKNNPEAQKIRNLRFKLKMEEKRVAIAGRSRPEICELCGEINENFTFTKYKTLFDHDHITGKFRGWICDRCNKVLGLVEDNPELLGQMIKYLTK